MATAETLQLRVQRITDRLERLADKKPTDGRLAKIERQEQKLAKVQARLAAVETPVAPGAIVAELPVDTFEITFKQPDAERSFYRFEVAVYDSPFDDSFTGGEPLVMRVNAEGRQKPNGGISNMGSTSSLANGPYWQGLNNQTLLLGSSTYESFLDYPTVTAYVAKDDKEWIGGGQLNDVLAVQTFDMTTLFG